MIPFIQSSKAKSLLLSFSLLLVLILSACGNSTTTTGSGGGSGSKGTIVVGSKLDVEGQLLGEMYILLLQKAGYTVTAKLALGNSIITSQALKSGAIDIYPDYTATGLNQLGIQSSYNPQTDFQTVKAQYEKQFKITWLDAAPLNDGYAICTSQAESNSLGVTSISQLVPKVPQLNLTSPSDGISFIDGLKKVYGFTTKSFKSVKQVDYSVGFQSVTHGQSQMTVCYTTDGTVQQQGFIFLNDDKNGFPQFNPAPLVRDAILTKYPNVAGILNPLAPDLTTEVSIQLQQQVAADEKSGTSSSASVKSVATKFLQSKGLM